MKKIIAAFILLILVLFVSYSYGATTRILPGSIYLTKIIDESNSSYYIEMASSLISIKVKGDILTEGKISVSELCIAGECVTYIPGGEKAEFQKKSVLMKESNYFMNIYIESSGTKLLGFKNSETQEIKENNYVLKYRIE